MGRPRLDPRPSWAATSSAVRIGRWVELRSDPLCLGQMLNRENSIFVRQIERHLRATQGA